MATMDPSSLVQSPFAPLTFAVAPALLTNASSVLAMSTVNRMVRAHDRMHGFFAKSEAGELSDFFTAQVDRVEKQASLLLRALHSIYIALAAFACATLSFARRCGGITSSYAPIAGPFYFAFKF